MSPERFQELVTEAVDSIPDYFLSKVANLQVEVRPYAPPDIARNLKHHPMGLLGVYQGVPFNRRGPWYGNVMPDRIIIFQHPIENQCRTDEDVRRLVRKVVIHEIGHYFGLSDPELRKLEREADTPN
jgi:predicted Zn-dependent protease with MMP-like domain